MTQKTLIEIDKQIQELQENIGKFEERVKEDQKILTELRTNRDKKVAQWKFVAAQIIVDIKES